MLTNLLELLTQQTFWEVIAVILGLAYVFLIARENIWGWPAAFISTAIYTAIFWDKQLPMQAFLNAYYLLMAVYGFTIWYRGSAKSSANAQLKIRSLATKYLIGFYALGLLITWLIASYLAANEFSKSPYLDSGIMAFSLLNTYLMAKKYIQNWHNWALINLASAILYSQAELYLTAAMHASFLILAVYGYLNWKKLSYS